MKCIKILKIFFLILFYTNNAKTSNNSEKVQLLDNKELELEVENCGKILKNYSNNIKNFPHKVHLLDGILFVNSNSKVKLEFNKPDVLREKNRIEKKISKNKFDDLYRSLIEIWVLMNEKKLRQFKYKTDDQKIHYVKIYRDTCLPIKEDNVISFKISNSWLSSVTHAFLSNFNYESYSVDYDRDSTKKNQ